MKSMSFSKAKRKLRVAALGLATLVVLSPASGAFAQSNSPAWPSPDGGPSNAAGLQQPVVTTCGVQLNSVIRTEEASFSTSSAGFVGLPGASTSITTATDCLLVTWSGETACGSAGGATDFCQMRALVDGVAMSPTGGDFFTISSENPTTHGHAKQWVLRVTAGAHVVVIQVRSSSASSFFLDDWTFNVERLD